LRDIATAVLRRKTVISNAYVRKEEKAQTKLPIEETRKIRKK
jgi:hypothetical protein